MFLVTGVGAFLLHVYAGAGPLTSNAVAIAAGMATSSSYEASVVIGTGLSAAIRFWSCREWVSPQRRPVPN